MYRPKATAFLSLFFLLNLSLLLTAQQRVSDLQVGIEFFRNREYEKALPIFEKLYEQNPSQVHYHYYFNCLLELNNYRKAEQAARRQIRANPGNLRFQIDLGFVYNSSGDVVKGRKEYDDVLKNLTADTRTINEVANTFMVRRENEYAIKTYLRGRELLGGSYGFHMELGNLYDRLGDFENAVNEYLSHLRTDQTNLSLIQTRFQNALFTDLDGHRKQYLRNALLRNIRLYPDVVVYSEMMLWFAIQQEDFESAYTQATALDRRFNEGGDRVFSIAQLSLANQQYDVAIKAYEYLIAQGEQNRFYLHSRIEHLNALYRKLNAQYPIDKASLEILEKKYNETLSELGKNRMTISLMRDLANLYAFMLDNTGKAIALLNEVIGMSGIGQQNKAEYKLDLADLLLYTGDVWEATLLYSQVEKDFPNEPIGHEAKLRNARLSFYIGEFSWARAQLNVLKAATSKLIANDAMALSLLIKDNMEIDSTFHALSYFARAELHSFRKRYDLALLVLDSLEVKFPYHPILDDVLYQKAEISIRRSDYIASAAFLQKIADQYPDGLIADKALFRLAEVYEIYLNDQDKAMEYYKELLLKYPASLMAAPARQRFRALRGDVI